MPISTFFTNSFKRPPICNLNGRGPPAHQTMSLFFALCQVTTDFSGLEKAFYGALLCGLASDVTPDLIRGPDGSKPLYRVFWMPDQVRHDKSTGCYNEEYFPKFPPTPDLYGMF